MNIIIPTRGRIGKQTTFESLPAELLSEVTFICPSAEVEALARSYSEYGASFMAQPEHIQNIAEKRKWIVETCQTESLVMLDDDLRFAYRREDDPSKFLKATDDQIVQGFRELEGYLSEDFPHGGFTARGGSINASAKKGGWQFGKRMMYVLGYHVPTVLKNAEFGRVATHEDMDICLQLLTKGFPNIVNFSLVVDQKFGNPGGCEDERTVESNNRDVMRLAELHPNLVRIVEKEYISSTSRLEVVCSWQRAWLDGE